MALEMPLNIKNVTLLRRTGAYAFWAMHLTAIGCWVSRHYAWALFLHVMAVLLALLIYELYEYRARRTLQSQEEWKHEVIEDAWPE